MMLLENEAILEYKEWLENWKREKASREITILLQEIGVNVHKEGYRYIYHFLMKELLNNSGKNYLKDQKIKSLIEETIKDLIKRNPKGFQKIFSHMGKDEINVEKFLSTLIDVLNM